MSSATIEQAAGLGGQVIAPALDTPGGCKVTRRAAEWSLAAVPA